MEDIFFKDTKKFRFTGTREEFNQMTESISGDPNIIDIGYSDMLLITDNHFDETKIDKLELIIRD